MKTVVRLTDPERTARWVWQPLAYAWSDTTDRYRLRTVGLYLAGHGQLVTWRVDELAAVLLGDHRPDQIERTRREFLTLASRVITAEGATPAAPDRADHCPDSDLAGQLCHRAGKMLSHGGHLSVLPTTSALVMK